MEPDRRELTESYPQPTEPQLSRRKSYSYAVLETVSVSRVYKRKSLILCVPSEFLPLAHINNLSLGLNCMSTRECFNSSKPVLTNTVKRNFGSLLYIS
jgi:hypothetical protein